MGARAGDSLETPLGLAMLEQLRTAPCCFWPTSMAFLKEIHVHAWAVASSLIKVWHNGVCLRGCFAVSAPRYLAEMLTISPSAYAQCVSDTELNQ